MGKQEESKNKKNEKIINTAFRIFVEKKIEPVSITEIAEKAGVGRADRIPLLSDEGGSGYCCLQCQMEGISG